MHRVDRNFLHVFALLAATSGSTGCALFLSPGEPPTKEEVNGFFTSAAIAEPYATHRTPKDQGGGFRTVHGMSCAEANKAVTVDNLDRTSYGVGVEETLAVPNGYVATVFLNGWRLKYHSSDHHVLAMANAIVDVVQTDGELQWTAGGVLTDRNGDDAFSWCYYYTALLWSPLAFGDATAYDSDVGAEMTFLLEHEEGFALSESTPYQLTDFDDVPAALLPRGFGITYYTGGDHHLKDFALKYGDPELVITSEDGTGSDILWNFAAAFGDRGFDDGFVAGELMTVITGEAVATTVDDFGVTDGLKSGGGSGERSVIRETVRVEVPDYEHAVPVLKGWSLGSPGGDDSHLKEIGAWIESFDYTPPTDDAPGRLTYTIASIYRDRKSTGARTPRYQVDIVGFNGVSGVVTQVPVSTGTMTQDDGTSPSPTPSYGTTSTTSTTSTGSFTTSTSTSTKLYQTSYGSYSTNYSF